MKNRVVSSAEEHSPHTRVAAGSNPALPTILKEMVGWQKVRRRTTHHIFVKKYGGQYESDADTDSAKKRTLHYPPFCKKLSG